MDWKQHCRDRLPGYLDEQGDLAPPWEQLPHYERTTIGWRMGAGEDWLGLWGVFLDKLDPTFEARLAYLKRHAPAPASWANMVYSVLHPSSQDDEPDEDEMDDEEAEKAAAGRRAMLLEKGLIASDIAYSTWLRRQEGVRWPWMNDETPEGAARYSTRELWFWSRQVAELRGQAGWAPPRAPERWQACAAALETGRMPALDLQRGLLSLAQMLCAGQVVPPWQLGLSIDDFRDSFDDDMGYVDAFRLWGMSAFDDREHMQRYLAETGMPASWAAWAAEQIPSY